MVSLSDIRDLVSSLFIMLNKKMFILFRIEFLVVLVTVLFLAMFIMDIFRRYIHSSFMKAIFSLFDGVSDSIVLYLLGAMQTAPFKNELFPVWALVLVSFRYSVDFISGYGVPDRGGRRFTEWRNVVKLLGSAFLNWSHGSRFALPLWLLWAIQILRSWYRLESHDLALNSSWLGYSSELTSEYMHGNHDTSRWKPEECNPETMEGYKYLVYGERIKLHKPRYVLQIDSSVCTMSRKKNDTSQQEDTTSNKPITGSSLVTLDRIWGCRRHLLCPSSDPEKLRDTTHTSINGKDLKDLSLAFALSRLLRCRLEDVMLQGNIWIINRELVKKRIIEETDNKCAFRIMELHLSFVNDYFNTRYPMVFWSGLFSLILSILQSVVTVGVVCWLSIDIRRVLKPPHGELAHLVHGFNVDMIITWVFMFFIVFKEIWEIIAYLLSDWSRLLMVCMYAKWDGERKRNFCMERIILSLFTSKITAKRWHGHIDQYVFMESYDYRPKIWNLIHKVTTGMIPKKDNGARLSRAIDVPDYVKPAILEKLNALLGQPDPQALTEPANTYRHLDDSEKKDGRCLPRVIMTLTDVNGDRKKWYGWACFDLKTSSETILLWHVATSLCEMALAVKHDVDLSKHGFLHDLISCFTDCFSSKPFLIDMDEKKKDNKEKESHEVNYSSGGYLCSLLSHFTECCSFKSNEKKGKFTKELKEGYTIANSLSRYCTYLLVSKPDLIPDSFLVPKMVFQKTVNSARDVILKDCNSLQSRYEKSLKEAEDISQSDDVVKQGAMLGKKLLDHEGEEGCWEILAGVWVELLIHVAPTSNTDAHKTCLESGGEFITNIWALLWHCGIEKSSLWPADDAPEDNAPADPQDNYVGNNNINTVGATDTRSPQVEVEVHEKSEILETEELEARNLEIGTRKMESIGESEIEEVSHSMVANGLNIQTGMAAGYANPNQE